MSDNEREGRAASKSERGWIREQAARFAVRLRLAITRRAFAVMGFLAGVVIQIPVILLRSSAMPSALGFVVEVVIVGVLAGIFCAAIGPKLASRVIEFVFRLP